MPRVRTPPGPPATFGEFVRSGDPFDAMCENPRCRHVQTLDMRALADRFGLDTPVVATLLGRLKCRQCGSRDVGFRRGSAAAQGGYSYPKTMT